MSVLLLALSALMQYKANYNPIPEAVSELSKYTDHFRLITKYTSGPNYKSESYLLVNKYDLSTKAIRVTVEGGAVKISYGVGRLWLFILGHLALIGIILWPRRNEKT